MISKRNFFNKLLTLSLLLISFGLQAQENVKGMVVDEDQQPISLADVYIDGIKKTTTNYDGIFIVENVEISSLRNLNVIKRGYKMQTWAKDGKNSIKVLLSYAPVFISGTALKGGKPIRNTYIKISGQKFQAAKTNSKGKFQLKVDRNFKVKANTVFLVDGDPVKSQYYNYNKSASIVVINIPGPIPTKKEIVAKKGTTKSTSTSSKTKTIQPAQIVEEDEITIDPILVVVVYDDDISPADSLDVTINEKHFLTDTNGEFEVYADSIDATSFIIDDYKIIKTKYDYQDNYMFVYISNGNEEQRNKGANIEYTENFQTVFNTLEAEKQILQETGVSLRKEIQKISEKLDKDANAKNKKALESYLERLTTSLIENELAYEDAQYKTNQMMSRMRTQIDQQETAIEQIEEEKEEVETERMLYFIIATISLFLIFIFYKNSQKLKEQRDDLQEITERLEQAKDDVVKSHEEMLSVKDIGQKFTATLDFETHMLDLQESVSELLPADTFGIGVYNTLERRLEFRNQISDSGLDTYFSESIDNAYSLAAWCFNNEVELIINDYDKENTLYIPQTKEKSLSVNKSLIYMPLIVEGKVVGIITMQTKEVDKYKDINISILKSLASYASIAVSNYIAYKELKEKNKSITDSMRYAKTIQSAILPSNSLLKDNFEDHFLLYRSKEIVSGDFYWFKRTEINGVVKKFVAVVDCTGHGVPGAFMSMIGNALLNDIVNVKGVSDTVDILNALNEGVKESLQQENSLNDDGMDIALICIEDGANESEKLIQFSGAKRPLYIFRNETSTLEVVAGASKSVGYTNRKKKEFNSQDIKLFKGDIVYLCSDGYVDQNNQNREKIGTLRLKALLEQNAISTMDQQKEVLEAELEQHQIGGVEQRDDITIIGLKV
ncbi:hypothetical protein EI427_07995 [Flammeovirga pectinis]|uniref:GAF domain-containing protein n=1 Tax=Flammeovirga pectinis TaxID=2494373 RepID=A0A3Q9FNA4_9BACT|nr:SpoIIE family protein phosphatase [Flammeovirga pectinis]AZQ62178.1 hypothetical protein EI427_07995 [Flammeovirga pectinis]